MASQTLALLFGERRSNAGLVPRRRRPLSESLRQKLRKPLFLDRLDWRTSAPAGILFAVSDVTRILSQIESGDSAAAEQLLPMVYDELRKLAAARLAKESPGQTLQATALVHEAYLRLIGGSGGRSQKSGVSHQQSADGGQSDLTPDPCRPTPAFHSRAHFFAAAAEAMRRILVENARQKASLKRGGQMQRLALADIAEDEASDPAELLALDEALQRLAQADPQAAQLVKLRYFAGLTTDEAAVVLGISSRTAYYAWEYARSWLRQELHGGDSRG